jgi:hypothetical protein
MEDLVLRAYEPGDELAILRSFNLVFREVCGPGYVDRELATWRWLYADNPAGLRIHLAVAADGVIAGHYAALPARAATPLGPTVFTQVVDSFVHPAYRLGLKRPGLFVTVARAALDRWTTLGDGMFHGMPIESARKMSIRFLGYTTWRSIDYLCRDVEDGGDPAAGPEVRRVERLGAEVDELAARSAAEKGCTAIRSAAYLEWRYVRCPSPHYEMHEARRGRDLAGLLVLRPVHELLPGACTIAELLTPPDDGAVLDALLACAMARARALGRRKLMAVFPPHARETGALHDRGFQSEPSALTFFRSIGCRLAQPGLDFATLGARWWYTLGDFDLV